MFFSYQEFKVQTLCLLGVFCRPSLQDPALAPPAASRGAAAGPSQTAVCLRSSLPVLAAGVRVRACARGCVCVCVCGWVGSCVAGWLGGCRFVWVCVCG